MQGVGHAHELSDADIEGLVSAARRRLARAPRRTLRFGAPEPHHEGVAWVMAADGVAAVRDATRLAIGDALGPQRRPADSPWAFVPHVTLAYATTDVPEAPVAQALESVDARPVEVTPAHASLIELHRDRRQYEWRTLARVPIGT